MAGFDLNRDPVSAERRSDGAGAIGGMPRRTNAFWFFVAFLGGGGGIWWTKITFDNAWTTAMVAAGVVLALAVYYVLNDENAPEEEGDNVYYLGLLFTLVSLMFTIVELFGSDTDAVRDADSIRVLLENFGIALTSTIVGIAGRVAVQNWQRAAPAGGSESTEDPTVLVVPPASASPRDLERFNRHLLGRIARDLTQGANALARFHRIVRSHASDTEDYLRNHSETLKRESTAFKETLQRNAETFAQELRSEAKTTLGTVGDSLGAAAKLAEALPEQLRSAHDGYLAEVRETTRSFHDEVRSVSGQSLDSFRGNVDAATESFLSLAQNLATVHERIGSLESGLEHASNASTALGNSAHQAAKSTTVLEVEADKLRAALDAVHTGAEAMKGMLDAMGELDTRIRAGRDAEATAAAVRQIGETLRSITTQAAAATERAAEAAELFDALTQSVRRTEDETRRAAKALRTLADEAEARAETLRQGQSPGWRLWNRNR